ARKGSQFEGPGTVRRAMSYRYSRQPISQGRAHGGREPGRAVTLAEDLRRAGMQIAGWEAGKFSLSTISVAGIRRHCKSKKAAQTGWHTSHGAAKVKP